MKAQAVALVIRKIEMATKLPPEEITTETLIGWARELWSAIDPENEKDTAEGSQWDFERMKEQRDLVVEELNAARRQIDQFASQQVHANRH